tara:strand:+ start:974 stop:1162 length:189 start_codon:yes stop_codon:yes gene_type:complete
LVIDMNRITRQLLQYINTTNRKAKQLSLSKNLIKEVDIGANGTQGYTIKQGLNRGKVLHASK